MKKLYAILLTFTLLIPFSSAFTTVSAEQNDVIKGNPITITDPVTGCTYNYVNFNGQNLVHPYMGMQAWTADGKSFLCGAKDSETNTGYIYLYNTETNEFTRVGKAYISTEAPGVIGTDNCVYYSSDGNIKKYDIQTKETTVLLPSSWGYSPGSITVSNDCQYIAFASNRNKEYWCKEGETAIFRYHIPTMTIEAYAHKFPYSNILNHHQINPENPDLVFFVHEGNIGEGEGQVPTYRHVYDRQWSVDFKTGEKRNMFKQGLTVDSENRPQNIVFTAHESWSASGKYLYMNCYSNSSVYGKKQCAIRCYADGSHREYLRGAATGSIAADHSMATGDDKFMVVDSGKNVYLLSTDTYQQFPIFYSETSRYDPETGTARTHPYHPHPCVARNHYKALWGIEHGGWGAENGGVVGVAWYDFTELAKKTANGGRTPVNSYIDRVSYTGLDCQSETISYNGKEANHAQSGKYIYYDINETVVDGVNETITLSFDYYDNTTNDLKLIYTNGIVTDNDYADSEDASLVIKRTGTNKWINKEITLNGNFENINPYRTDFKIGGNADTYIANLAVVGAPDESDVYAGGDGTKGNPYLIESAAQLKYFSNSVRTTTDKTEVDSNISYTATKVSDTTVTTKYTPKRYHVFTDKYFKLVSDIDLGGETWTPIGNLINNFNGHFDGNGHTISNAYINGSIPVSLERYAFFGATGADVEIRNLGLLNLTCIFRGSNNSYPVTIDGENYTYKERLIGAAGFVSSYAGGTFENCYLKNVKVNDVQEQMGSGGTGGFFGTGYGTRKATDSNGYNAMTVTNCYINGAVIRAHSNFYGFIGPNMMPNSMAELNENDQYRITRSVKNCYTANITRGYYKDSLGISTTEKCYDGTLYPFGATTKNITYDNCYTTSMGEKTVATANGGTYTYTKAEIVDRVLERTDIENLKSNLIDDSNYYDDISKLNDGYPVLFETQISDVWDGKTDKKPRGEGTQEKPFLISTKEELLWFKNSVNTITEDGVENGYTSYANAYFKLTNDIDFEGYLWEPVGNNVAEFKGHFDGNGHVIKNFKIITYSINFIEAYKTADATSKSSLCIDPMFRQYGFFGKTGKNSVVKNLGIENAKINFWNHDYYYNIKLNESDVLTSYKTIRAQYNGVMVGCAKGKFINCYVKNSELKNMNRAIHDLHLGGFVGYADSISSFEGCYVKNAKLSSSVYSSFGGFVGNAIENSTFTDCYAVGVVENRDFASNRDHESTIYGFGCAAKKINATNCISDLFDYQAKMNETTGYKPADYIAEYSIGKIEATKDEIQSVFKNSLYFLADEIGINDGYPVCPWEKVPFRNYAFTTTKAGGSIQGFVKDGTINKVSFYKNTATEDCYMYTVLYDKSAGNRMVGCSIDYIDNDKLLSGKTHEITLSTPLVISKNTSDYVLKLIFIKDNKRFIPLCDNFEYSE